MKKILPLLCIAAFAISVQNSAAFSWGRAKSPDAQAAAEAKKTARAEAKVKKAEAKEAEKVRSQAISQRAFERAQTYKEEILDGKSTTEFVYASKELSTKVVDIVKRTNAVIAIMNKSITKKPDALKGCDISIIPVIRKPFFVIKEELEWLAPAVNTIVSGITGLSKIKTSNTKQEIDARNNISIGLQRFPSFESYTYDLEYALVSLVKFLETREPKISDAVAIEKAIANLKTAMAEKEKKFLRKAQETLDANLSAFESAYGELCGEESNDITLRVFSDHKSYISSLSESMTLFSEFLSAFEIYLKDDRLGKQRLQSLAEKCRANLARKNDTAEDTIYTRNNDEFKTGRKYRSSGQR